MYDACESNPVPFDLTEEQPPFDKTHDGFDDSDLCFFPVSDAMPPVLSEARRLRLNEQCLSGHVDRNLDYKDCVLVDGPIRQHRSVSSEIKRLGVMHIDIVGPMAASWSSDRYVVVAALRLEGVGLLYNARAIKTKSV